MISALRVKSAGALILAVLSGLVVGYFDMKADEVQGSVLLILFLTFLLGLVAPKGAWRWALIVGFGVPLAYLLAPLLHYKPYDSPFFSTFLAFIPAFIGAYSGVFFIHLLSPSTPDTMAKGN